MKTLTPEERREALKSFVDDASSELDVVDRSTIERWANCPWQAKAIEDGRCKTVGILAEAGEAVHVALSRATHSWIDSHGAMSPSDLRDDVEFEVRNSRPDLQPDAIKAIQPSLWSWSKLMYGIHPGNILAFDGGEDIDRSGQLAIDIPDLGTRVTSELDLLYQGDDPEVGEEVDYKTGHKFHDVETVAGSFQFQLHAVLALEKYPDWKALRVRIFDTRINTLQYPVYFRRERLHQYMVRIRSAVDARRTHYQNPPTWPLLEKCGICHAAALCPVADQPMANLAADPAAFVKSLIAVEARADAMRKLAADWVDANQQDIQCGEVFFGRRKPPSNRKPAATIYELTNKE